MGRPYYISGDMQGNERAEVMSYLILSVLVFSNLSIAASIAGDAYLQDRAKKSGPFTWWLAYVSGSIMFLLIGLQIGQRAL